MNWSLESVSEFSSDPRGRPGAWSSALAWLSTVLLIKVLRQMRPHRLVVEGALWVLIQCRALAVHVPRAISFNAGNNALSSELLLPPWSVDGGWGEGLRPCPVAWAGHGKCHPPPPTLTPAHHFLSRRAHLLRGQIFQGRYGGERWSAMVNSDDNHYGRIWA